MIAWTPQQWTAVRAALALYAGGAAAVEADDRCVNEGGTRLDGSFCRDRAEPNGWCQPCWAEVGPAS